MNHRAFSLFFMVMLLCGLGVYGQQKYALVVGNAAYTSVTRLNNPVNDANDIAATLERLGFQVDKVLDGNLDRMENAVIRMKNRLSASNSAYGFFFYAGHGVQSNGQNYLIPVDAAISSENLLRQRAMSMQFILDELNDAGNTLNIVVLDACRDNPFSWGRSGTRGLQVMGSQPADSIVVYATSAGKTAADGTGRNGLFTSQLLKHLGTPGLEISEVFRRTGADVSSASNREQIPAVYNQFFGSVYLGGATPVTPKPPDPKPPSVVMAPQAPRNVRAGTPGTDRVMLNWDSVGSGVSYKVYYNTQNDPARASTLGNLATGTSMDVTGMASGTTYYFWVSTVRGSEESEKSPVVTVLTAAVTPNVPSNMVRINGGTFMMGSPASEAGRWDDEGPQHRVTVSSFFMGKYEVTQKEYQAVMGTNPSRFKGDNLPVEQVSWFEAVEYCNARSRKEGLALAYTISGSGDNRTVTWNRNANGYRLPTEAEWEYACRAGTTTPYSSGSSVDAAGWYSINSGRKTHPVGTKQANAWGLYDLHGNVREWCWDWFGDCGSSAQTDPVGASSGTYRVERGGSWGHNGRYLRSACRDYYTPSNRYGSLGFRLARPSL
ncbi:MAG: SUMF1/EgtB/PvdO family nonheme iron enzyme [Treponema sp.]|jgi:formylglycine-generating enzyme required for sulfatase activity|nr:SUMF1/EgtB/PvdO family nonheme iron enzyme [Treponema sp.]